jgi:cyclopropane fatty-acyl-phospholipid synthase-like methyltransferase
VLTVDYDRLRVTPGERLLDLGCGAGRHAFEAARRGARVVALDSSDVEVKEAGALLAAMETEGSIGAGGSGAGTVANALALPFADGTFDRVIAAEVEQGVARLDPEAVVVDRQHADAPVGPVTEGVGAVAASTPGAWPVRPRAA